MQKIGGSFKISYAVMTLILEYVAYYFYGTYDMRQRSKVNYENRNFKSKLWKDSFIARQSALDLLN